MLGVEVLAAITLALTGLGVAELVVHRRRLRRIPVRVHVNGTRGKSSVTRLIAAGLRAGGVRACAKTTGTTPRFILPDGTELPIFRPAGANIIEQRRIVAVAAAHQAEALVLECMALQPLLQSLCELELVRSTHGVVTNARPDHLEVLGPGAEDVARAMAGAVPVGGRLYTAEREHLAVLREAAEDRGTELVEIAPLEAILGEEGAADAVAGFSHTEHPDNLAVALRVCDDLGVDADTALAGMHAAPADPGAMTERRLDFFGRTIAFVNGFAANDPISTEQVWHLAIDRHEDVDRKIAIFNCRADRPERSIELGRRFVSWDGVDRVVLMGSGTLVFASEAVKAGFDAGRLVFAEGLEPDAVFERVLGLCGRRSLVLGVGNTVGGGLELAQYFANRAVPEPSLPGGT